VGKKRTGLSALHRDHPDKDTGAVGQHVELERPIDSFDKRLNDALAKGRLTRAENQHMVRWLLCSVLLRELHESASDSGERDLSGPERLAPHPDHLGEEVGAADQHVELERLIDSLAKRRLTKAVLEHLSLCVRCSALLRELHEFASDSGARSLPGPERLAPHPDHLGEEVGAAGQHVELERLTAYLEGRITAAEREELQEHLSLCVRCSVLLRELHEFGSDSVRQDAGAAGQHTELERLIAFYEKRVTEAEREEVLDHLNLCVRCAALLQEFHEFSRDSGERGLTGPEHLEQEAWEALQRQRSSVRKEPASQPVATAERRLSLFRSAQRFFTETSAGLLRAVLRPFARGRRAVRLKITLGLELRAFDITHQRLLVYALAEFLNITPEEIVVTTVEEGSVKVTVQLPAKAAKKLLAAFETRDSSLFELLSHSLTIDASLEPQEHADRGIRPSSVDVGFEEFRTDVEPRLKRLLAYYHIPIDDREDIVQQALLALLYHWEKIREPEPWLFGTINRKCLLYWRERRRELFGTREEVPPE
jgi:hypothetical protein